MTGNSQQVLAAELAIGGFLSVPQASSFSGLGKSKLYQLMGMGELPYAKVGSARRIPKRALAEMMAQRLVINDAIEPDVWLRNLNGQHAVVVGDRKTHNTAYEHIAPGKPVPDTKLTSLCNDAIQTELIHNLKVLQQTMDRIDRGIQQLVEHNARRSGRRAGIKPALRDAVLKRDGLLCRYCGKQVTRETLHLDHVRPVALGGQTIKDNLVVCCIKCNRRKGQYLIEEIGMSLRPIPNSDCGGRA